MLTTDFFMQLTPSTLSCIRNRCRLTERRKLPISLQFLVDCGVSRARIEPLKQMVAGERLREMFLVNAIILNLFEGQYLLSRAGLTAWLRRRGGCPRDLWEAGVAFARELIEEDGGEPAELTRSRVLLEQARNERQARQSCAAF